MSDNESLNGESDLILINGFMLANTFLPEEIMVTILSYVDWKDLLFCRLVCRSWKRMIDFLVCCEKLKRSKNLLKQSFVTISKRINYESIPFNIYYAIGQRVFGNNLLKNVFGLENCSKFKHWEVIASHGDGWIVETPPQGCDPLPEELEGTSCFATSFGSCCKKQHIELGSCGLSPKIMDEIQPHFEVSEWYAGRFDCGSIYNLRVSLFKNIDEEPVQLFEDEKRIEQWRGREWHKISHTFKDYGPGIRYVEFKHKGNDTQFWAGHYGSKMAGASVIARIPTSLFEEDLDSSL